LLVSGLNQLAEILYQDEKIKMRAIDYRQLSQDYTRIERAIDFLQTHFHEQPSLSEMAHSVNLSEYHFQRLFSRWVGISPKRFMQYLTKEHAKQLLVHSEDLLSVSYATGLSGPSRLHDLFVTCEAVTPGEYKKRGQGLEIRYGFHFSPFGECLVALTERGICNLMFGERNSDISSLRKNWPAAQFIPDYDGTKIVIDEMMELFQNQSSSPVRLYLNGTNFQIKVWEALLNIPSGSVVSYEDVAIHIGMPGASRAVGNAISRNPIPVLIPCHRVIRKSGEFGDYRWGASRKKALLGWESAKLDLARTGTNLMVSA
jgi:AraC family transcriptional regulator of adaptative response/methylated-DNA-[protein]-cysteine methyltransferase